MTKRRLSTSIVLVLAVTGTAACLQRNETKKGGFTQSWEKGSYGDVVVSGDGKSAKRIDNRAAIEQTDPGITFAAQGTPNPAEQDIDRLREKLKEDPKNPEWYFRLGSAYEQRQFLGDAERYYRQGKALCPSGYTGPHFYLGRVLLHQKRFDEALAELQACVAVKPLAPSVLYSNPDYRESFYLMGFIHYVREDKALSEECFRLFIQYGGERSRVAHFFPQLIGE